MVSSCVLQMTHRLYHLRRDEYPPLPIVGSVEQCGLDDNGLAGDDGRSCPSAGDSGAVRIESLLQLGNARRSVPRTLKLP